MLQFPSWMRQWFALGAAAALLSLTIISPIRTSASPDASPSADDPSGCDFAPNGTTPSCLPPLTGSTFAGGDGNLLTNPTIYGTTDWQNVAGLKTGVDLPSGQQDNSFGQGTKEDDPSVTVVSGSIPPNKSDLTRFYVASQTVNTSNFLYLAWERTNNLGSANMDFEINQKTQPDLTTPGPKTLNRTAGDLLVTFDFTNGGGRPVLGILRWLTTSGTCLSSNSFPCWGNQLTLDGTDSIGAVNNLGSVTDPFVSNSPNNIGALRFGEAAINLTAAGVFPAGTCTAFGSTFLKSRSSASFPAEVKDFIAPISVNISNCGHIKIVKNTDPRNVDQDFAYTSTIPNPSNPTADPRSPQCSADATPSSFTLNDKTGGVNTEDCVNVPAGSYTVTETTPLPANFTLKSLTCTVDGTGGSTGSQDSSNTYQANITLFPNDTVTCTYTNQQQLGAIVITKTGKDKNCTGANTPAITNGVCTASGTANLSGATFTVKDSTTGTQFGGTLTTGTNGTVCVGNLPWSGIGTTYSVTETGAPQGYSNDAGTTPKTVNVTQTATCTAASGQATVSFTDTPLTNISVNAKAVVAGITSSTITCTAGGNPVASAGPGDNVTASTTAGLPPGTYTCTIVIDP